MQTPYIDLFEGFNAIYNKYELEVVENARLFSLEIPNVAILLIAGGSASGTTTLAQALQRKINNEYRSDFGRDLVGLISMDHYYKNRNASDLSC